MGGLEGFARLGHAPPAPLPGGFVEAPVGPLVVEEDQLSFHVTEYERAV